jgi:hypothetical protein
VLLYFGGYPALQFQNRHYFHLEFMGWWCVGFLVQRALDAVQQRARLREFVAGRWSATWPRRLAAFSAVAVAALWLPLATLRAYQHQATTQVIQTMISAPRSDVVDGEVASSDDPRKFQYLDIELDPSRCAADASVALAYDRARPGLRRVIPVAIDSHVARHVIAPVFWHFRGVEVENGDAACVRTVRQLTLPPGVPALPTLVLPDDWGTLPLHQRLR